MKRAKELQSQSYFSSYRVHNGRLSMKDEKIKKEVFAAKVIPVLLDFQSWRMLEILTRFLWPEKNRISYSSEFS